MAPRIGVPDPFLISPLSLAEELWFEEQREHEEEHEQEEESLPLPPPPPPPPPSPPVRPRSAATKRDREDEDAFEERCRRVCVRRALDELEARDREMRFSRLFAPKSAHPAHLWG